MSSANVTLSFPSGATFTPGAGPTQSQNALIRLTGTLTSNVILTLPMPGYYIVENLCSGVASYYVQVASGTTTGAESIGAPPGKQQHIFNDGTAVRYVNMPDPGTFLDLCIATTPAWHGACTVKPWLLCDGTVYNYSNFTALAQQLGSTFGGNGITTFAVPPLMNRLRVSVTTAGSALITPSIAHLDGTVWGAIGGDQNVQLHNHTLTDPGHQHTSGATPATSASGGVTPVSYQGTTGTASTGITLANYGTGTSANIPPMVVAGICLIKT